jgi:hypothetical protein
VLPGSPWLVVGTPRLVVSSPRLIISTFRLVVRISRLVVATPSHHAGASSCSQVLPMFSSVLRGVCTLITITPIVLLYSSSEIPVTPKASWNVLLESNTPLKLTHLNLHSTSSQKWLDALSNKIHCDVLRSAGMRRVYQTIVPAEAISGAFSGAGGLAEVKLTTGP